MREEEARQRQVIEETKAKGQSRPSITQAYDKNTTKGSTLTMIHAMRKMVDAYNQ
jgi:hypothetical protein